MSFEELIKMSGNMQNWMGTKTKKICHNCARFKLLMSQYGDKMLCKSFSSSTNTQEGPKQEQAFNYICHLKDAQK